MIFLGVVAGGFGPNAYADEPSVMSLDFCADQYVLAFAKPENIVAVSDEAADINSFFAARAAGLPVTRGALEDVLLRKPDLVVRTWRGSMAGDAMAKRLDIHTYRPPYAMTPEDNLRNLVLVAEALGGASDARAMVDDYHTRWEALKKQPASKLKAVYMTPSGFTAGQGTFVDDIIQLAGFDTVATAADVHGWVPLPLEKMVMDPPGVVIGSFFNEGTVHISHWSGGRHGAYRNMIKELPTIMVPSRYLSCSGAFFVDAAEFIRAEAEKLGLFHDAERAR
ncbi:ABC transporter substrate-binding protein [Kordiimonas aestuarii]|uniref:ABC transporter substrate-binding protein n=1 Tax=Kordiimonas aestuarii TaxID=1005925 RepID=UPI0021D25F36|nr:ABC transporter substrate-binding protein [Kordiimonas aestuarii]